jgi:phosphoribosylformylglycinamidine synthase
LSENRRVLGLMPHPERALDPLQGSADGTKMFGGLLRAMAPV